MEEDIQSVYSILTGQDESESRLYPGILNLD